MVEDQPQTPGTPRHEPSGGAEPDPFAPPPPFPPEPFAFEADALADFESPVAPNPPKRFCGSCGSVWQVEWIECVVCATQRSALADPSLAPRESSPLASALGLYFVLLGSFFLILFADESSTARFQLIVSAVDAVVVLFWLVGSGPIRTAGPRLLGPPLWYPVAAISGVCTFLLAAGIIKFLVAAFQIDEITASDDFLNEGYGWGVIILAVCVQPAVIEEIAFRGIILGALRKVMSDREAIITSALMFAILHLSVLSIPHLFVIGALTAIIRLKSGSLLPCMLLHFVHNGLVLASEAGWF